MESVLTKLYDALGQLRYPEITKIDSKDLATTILAGQNRIDLLTWLLSRASPMLLSHFEKFQGTTLKDEVVKCYLQMGISNDENALLGNCSMKQQLLTLRALLSFTKSLDSTQHESVDESVVYEVLDQHIHKTINIIPPSCHVSMKLTNFEVKKYLDKISQNLTTAICEPSEIAALTVEDKINLDDIKEIENKQIPTLDPMAGTFSTAFESVDFWQNSKSSDSQISEGFNIDETIQNLCKDLNSITQVFESKQAILTMEAPKCSSKSETPLSLLIEDNVIFSEEIRKLYDQIQLEN